MTTTEEAAVAKAALDLALIAAPIYAENSFHMRRSAAIEDAVRSALALIGAAKEFISVRSADL